MQIIERGHGNPLVIVVDNDGYTVERAIHGPAEDSNEISRWAWTKDRPSLPRP